MTAVTYSLALHRVRGIFVSVCLYFSSYCVGLCQMIPVVADAGDVAEVIVIAGYATACQQVGAAERVPSVGSQFACPRVERHDACRLAVRSHEPP